MMMTIIFRALTHCLAVRYFAAELLRAMLPAGEMWSVVTESSKFNSTCASLIPDTGGKSFVCTGAQSMQLSRIKVCSVSCTGNRHPIPWYRAPAVTMIGWYGTALGCRRRRPAGCRPPRLQLGGNSKWRRRLSD